MNDWRRAWYFAGLVLLSGCSFSIDSESDAVDASVFCIDDADCGSGGFCVEGVCGGGETTFDQVLMEVAVPKTPAAAEYAGARYLLPEPSLPVRGGGFNLVLPGLAPVKLKIAPPPCEDTEGDLVPREDGACPDGAVAPSGRDACTYDFGQQMLEAVLTPAEHALGITTVRYTTTLDCASHDCGRAEGVISVPPGKYDLYLRRDSESTPLSSGGCAIVPEILETDVPQGAELLIDYELTEPELLDGKVVWPLDNDPHALAGWTVDMLDAVSGRRISSEVVLDEPVLGADEASYLATPEFVVPATDAVPGSELVRLRPPTGTVAPTVVIERSALSLFEGPALIDQLTSLPAPVLVEGQVLAQIGDTEPAQLAPLGARVEFLATEINALPPGALASFRQSLDAAGEGDSVGVFQAELLAGKYRVRVVPPGSCSDIIPCADASGLCECPLAATEISGFLVAESPSVQAGKTLEVVLKTRVTGQALTPSRYPVDGVTVQAVSVPHRATALETVLGDEAFVPRAASASTGSDGRFRMMMDSGAYHVAVRPSEGSGLAWGVRPNVSVRAEEASLPLGELVLPLPVTFSGTLSVPGGAVLADAVVRAYVPVDSLSPQSGMVQVAETRTSAAGAYTLLLPESLEHIR